MPIEIKEFSPSKFIPSRQEDLQKKQLQQSVIPESKRINSGAHFHLNPGHTEIIKRNSLFEKFNQKLSIKHNYNHSPYLSATVDDFKEVMKTALLPERALMVQTITDQLKQFTFQTVTGYREMVTDYIQGENLYPELHEDISGLHKELWEQVNLARAVRTPEVFTKTEFDKITKDLPDEELKKRIALMKEADHLAEINNVFPTDSLITLQSPAQQHTLRYGFAPIKKQ
jgi:hypothetical protein